MCGHAETLIVDGIETCRTCGMWRTHKGIEEPSLGPWRFAHEAEDHENPASDDAEVH